MRLLKTIGRFPWLSAGFALALVLTVLFSVRLFHAAERWSHPILPDQPLAGWMTPRYAARCMHVPPEVVAAILNLDAEDHKRRATLSMLAQDRGVDEATFLRDLEAAIVADRAAQGSPPARLDLAPPPPPPGAPQ